MVLRERKISNKSDDVQLHLSYGLPDVKSLLKVYESFGHSECDEPFIKTQIHTESDVRYFFEHSPQAFVNYPLKWKEQLSGWAFCVAVRNGLLKPTAANENQYKLADCLFAKRGRPKKKSDFMLKNNVKTG